jgi:hypothetical protein
MARSFHLLDSHCRNSVRLEAGLPNADVVGHHQAASPTRPP